MQYFKHFLSDSSVSVNIRDNPLDFPYINKPYTGNRGVQNPPGCLLTLLAERKLTLARWLTCYSPVRPKHSSFQYLDS